MRYGPPNDIGCKRPSDDDVTAEPLSKNSKLQALANAIINDTPEKKMDYSNKLPAVDEKTLMLPMMHLKHQFL